MGDGLYRFCPNTVPCYIKGLNNHGFWYSPLVVEAIPTVTVLAYFMST